jgi:hypothetical protein
MDYKSEVLKVYPDADCAKWNLKDGDYIIYNIETDIIDYITIGTSTISESLAWQSAYEKLKQEGKIK